MYSISLMDLLHIVRVREQYLCQYGSGRARHKMERRGRPVTAAVASLSPSPSLLALLHTYSLSEEETIGLGGDGRGQLRQRKVVWL